MKGIGILLVLWGHVWQMGDTSGHVINSFHMPLFFIIAGRFSKSWDEIGTANICATFLKYVRRMYVPFAFATILLAAWFCVKAMFSPQYWNTVTTTLLSLLWASTQPLSTPWGDVATGVVWFLITLMVAKSMFLFLSKVGKWTLPLALCISLLGYLLSKTNVLFPFCLLQSMIVLPYIVVGWLWRKYDVPHWLAFCLIALWILANVFSSMVLFDCRMDCYPLDLVGALGGTYVVYIVSRLLAKQTQYFSKVFAFLGVCSLSIMCFHYVELNGHVGNHVLGMLHMSLPAFLEYVVRYTTTIVIAIGAMYTPIIKKIFV